MTAPRKRTGRAAAKAVTPQPEQAVALPPIPPGPPVDPPEPDQPVHVLWARVMEGVRSIAKGDYNEEQGFSFRGVDSVTDAVGPALRRAGIFVVPHKVREHSATEYLSKRGSRMVNRVVRVQWRVYGPRGDWFAGESMGEAADTGDKSLSKAQSVAYRVYLLQALSIPTGERDPDADSHERASEAMAVAPRREEPQDGSQAQQSVSQDGGEQGPQVAPDVADARAELWRVAKELGWNWSAVAQRFRADHGTGTDGSDAATINAFREVLVREAAAEQAKAKEVGAEVLGAKEIPSEGPMY